MSACPPFVTVGMLIELLPNLHEGTIYRFNTAAGGRKRLPPYDLNVGVGLWSLDTIRGWADRTGLVLDPVVLERIEKEQTV